MNVLEIEPIRYCVPASGTGTSPAPLTCTSAPSRTIPATSDGTRPVDCVVATSSSTRRMVSGSMDGPLPLRRSSAKPYPLTTSEFCPGYRWGAPA